MDRDIVVDETVPSSIRPAVAGLVARLLASYPNVHRVHIALEDRAWIVTAWDGTGASVADRELITAIRQALTAAEER